jgi:uncharacterized ferritin-like protein (DUF455 family)
VNDRSGRSVAAAAAEVLRTGDVNAKVMAARAAARAWRSGGLAHRFDVPMPAEPAWPDRPELLPPGKMPKRGKAGSERGRIALLHALAHIEFVAIDLALDMVGRFGAAFPRAFVDDWMRVVAEEAMHFAILDRRLRMLGHPYGALPAHGGLWQAAEATAGDVLARLAVVPMVLEARALDVSPATIARFESVGDAVSARLLARILRDEINHVAIGVRWFRMGCAEHGFAPAEHWRALVGRYFGGSIKPPFNDSARAAAGLTKDFYASLAG